MLPGYVDFCGSAVLESSQPLCLPTFPFAVSSSCGTAALTHGRDFLVFPWSPSASVSLALLLNADFWEFLSRSTHDFLFFSFFNFFIESWGSHHAPQFCSPQGPPYSSFIPVTSWFFIIVFFNSYLTLLSFFYLNHYPFHFYVISSNPLFIRVALL